MNGAAYKLLSNIPIPQAHETDCQFNMFAYPKKQCHLHSLLTIISLWRYGIMANAFENRIIALRATKAIVQPLRQKGAERGIV